MDMYFKTACKNHVKSVLLTGIIISILYSTYRIENNLESSSLSQMLTGVLWINFVVYIVLVFFAVIVAHSALHHIIYKLFDRSLFKGIRYASYNPNEDSLRIINSYQHALIELLPLAIVSIACTFIPGWIGQIAFACNILVSIGDVYNLLEIIRSKKYNYVKADEPNHVNDVTEINI
jgi:hypothetical protein